MINIQKHSRERCWNLRANAIPACHASERVFVALFSAASHHVLQNTIKRHKNSSQVDDPWWRDSDVSFGENPLADKHSVQRRDAIMWTQCVKAEGTHTLRPGYSVNMLRKLCKLSNTVNVLVIG